MSSELVSIIVPSYGHEKYIIECLQSLHAQTHERIELIMIDDRSPDRTFDLAQALLATPFRKRFENVILRQKDVNGGAHESLNMGLELASGDYIAIINSDDLFKPERLTVMLKALKDAGSEFAFSIVETISEEPAAGQHDRDGEAASVPPSLMLLGLRQHLALARDVTLGFALLRQNVGISTGNFLFSANIAKTIGAFLPLKYCHDWDFILQALVYTEPVVVPEILYSYRLHSENSFRSYQHLAEIETEVVLRRFFRSVLQVAPPNARCPSPHHWPDYFEAFLRQVGYWPFWAKEAGEALPGWRTYDRHETRKLSMPSTSAEGEDMFELALRSIKT